MLASYDFEISKCFRSTSLCSAFLGPEIERPSTRHQPLDYSRILPWLIVRPCPTLGSAVAHVSESFVGVVHSRRYVYIRNSKILNIEKLVFVCNNPNQETLPRLPKRRRLCRQRSQQTLKKPRSTRCYAFGCKWLAACNILVQTLSRD